MTPTVGALVYPLDWTGARLTVEPVAVARTWTDACGNSWVGLADSRNFLAELCEPFVVDESDQNRPETAWTMNRSTLRSEGILWCCARRQTAL